MTSDDGPATDPLEGALGAAQSAYAHAERLVRAEPDPRRGFDAATRLANTLRDIASSAAQIRADMAAHIWQAEELSLAGLAQRIGVSKARAAQLVNAAQADTREGDNDG